MIDRNEARCCLTSHNVLFSCEGTCEEVVMKRLLDAGALVVDSKNIVRDEEKDTPYTRLRSARDIEQTFLGVEYPKGPLLVARIVDVNPGKFLVSRPRCGDVVVQDYITKTEIEALALVKEGRYADWKSHRVKGKQLLPSQYCESILGMRGIKRREYLLDYWSDANELVHCIVDLHRLLEKEKDSFLTLRDLLKDELL